MGAKEFGKNRKCPVCCICFKSRRRTFRYYDHFSSPVLPACFICELQPWFSLPAALSDAANDRMYVSYLSREFLPSLSPSLSLFTSVSIYTSLSLSLSHSFLFHGTNLRSSTSGFLSSVRVRTCTSSNGLDLDFDRIGSDRIDSADFFFYSYLIHEP